jgi:hypothetical protein
MCAKWTETSIPMVHLHPRAAELLVTSQPGKGMTNSCRQIDADRWWGQDMYAIHHRQTPTLKSGQRESDNYDPIWYNYHSQVLSYNIV